MTPEEQAEIEAERDEDVRIIRRQMQVLAADALHKVDTLAGLAARLGDGPGNLCDVEFAETSDQRTFEAAVTQARVALAAIHHTTREIP